MKTHRILLLTAASLLFNIGTSFAQLEEGDVFIDIHHGLLGGKKGVIYTLIENADATSEIDIDGNLKTSYLGPIGGRVEYMIDDKISIGLESNYTKRVAEWTDENTESVYNPTTDEYETSTSSVDYTLTQSIIRIMVRTNYFFVNEEKYQIGFSNSLGYRMVRWDFKPFDDYYTDILTLSTWPLAYRGAFNLHYYFIPNLGINAEIGFSGGAYVNAGLSAKF